MTYKVSLSPRAEHDLLRIQGRLYLRLQEAIKALASNPRPPGCRKLLHSGEWRICVGVYRVRYQIDDTHQEVIITRVGHRREIYR
jgi:mRNA interferase RelE/StbE